MTSRVAVTLGMTRGAFLAFLLIYAVTVVALWRIGELIHDSKGLSRQNAQRIRDVAVTQEQLALQQQQIAALARDGAEAHAGLCVFRADLRLRVRQGARGLVLTRRLIREHPEGILGLDRATTLRLLKDSEAQQEGRERTAASLAGIECP